MSIKYRFAKILIFIFLTNNILAQKTDLDYCNKSTNIYNNNLYVKQNQLLTKYDLKFCKIDISASDTTTYIDGYVFYKAIVTGNILDTFILELSDDFIVDTVFVNGIQKSFNHSNNEIRIVISPSLSNGEYFNSKICYHGKPANTPNNRGITNSFDTIYHKQVTFSLAEPYYAKDWFPCKQDLTDKIDSAYIFITVDSTLKAGSNGKLTAITQLLGSKARYEWKTYHPIDYYLLSFSVSDYKEYNIYAKPIGYQDSILIQNYVYPNCLNYFKPEIELTKNYIEYFSDKFGFYPFADEKYGHCMAPIGGGMEHQTMTTLGYFNLSLVSHELSHQWWGDATTCKTWQDIWINEGFASYCEYLAVDNFSVLGLNWLIDCQNRVLLSPGGSVYVPFLNLSNYSRIFDYRLSYKKGAAIIHQLRFELNNDSLFFLALKNFLIQYKNNVATGLDFKNSFENSTNKNFTDYFDEWYFGEGYPLYEITWNQQNDTLLIYSLQTTSSNITNLFKSSLEFKIYYTGGDTIIRLFQNSNSELFKIQMQHPVDSIFFDPQNWLLKKLKYIHQNIIDIPINSVNINPNPFMDEITVNFDDNSFLKTIEIFDITGEIKTKLKTTEKLIRISTTTLPSGVYIIKVVGKTNIIKKIVKI